MLAAISCVFFSCSKNEIDLSKYKTHYTTIPDSLEVLPGLNRVKVVSVVSDPEVVQLKVYWNNNSDSLIIPINNATEPDTLRVFINNIPEGKYNFNVYTIDKNGVTSRKLDLTSQTYGDVYINSISNRAVNRSVIVNGESRIIWDSNINAAVVGVEIKYKTPEGVTKKIWEPVGEAITRINEDLKDNTLEYRTAFLPDNRIDTIFTDFTTLNMVPAVPAILDKGRFKELKLPTDVGISKYAKFGMDGLWDNLADNSGFYGTADLTSPHWFTFDMGVTANLNRYVMQQRPGNSSYNLLYTNANIKEWEVWGSNDPNPDGSWDSWTKLMVCNSVKPSGLPRGQLSQQDINVALAGEVFTFPRNTPAVRYIRIKVLDTWDPAQNDHSLIGELTFYGILE